MKTPNPVNIDLNNTLRKMESLCTACLCSGRNLYLLTENSENELNKIFEHILNDISELQCRLRVSVYICWECHALLRRFQQFRAQVKSCYVELLQCLQQNPTTLPQPRQPKLQLHHIQSTTISEPVKEELDFLEELKSEKDDVHVEPETVAYEFTMDKNEHKEYNRVRVKAKQAQKKVKLKKAKRKKTDDEELVISNDDRNVGSIEYNGDEDSVAAGDGCDFEEIYAERDSEIIVKPDLHVTGTNRRDDARCSGDGFSESDDEPLGMKRKAGKPRSRRRKKESAPEQLKVTTSKREKPAGVVHNSRVSRKLQQLNVQPDQLEMIVLDWDEVEAERQRALASDTFTRHQYSCVHCAVGFNHRCKLDDHMKKHDPASGPAECSACTVRCRDSHALAAHRRRHRVRWRCRECGGMWSRAAVAADHVARAHGGNTPTHTCSVCGHLETTLGKLRNHMKNHSERQKCELCGKTFRDRTSLRTHLFIHKGEKEYSCHRCEKRFLFKRALEVHLVTHLASAHLYCHQCDMNFKNRMSYNQHMKYNLKHIDPARLKYACDACDKKFVKATRLHEHKLAVHLKMTPIRCAVPGCGFACSSRPVLRTHVRMLHRDARARRNHVCDVCGKAYTTKKSLEGHLRTHTGERPFRCARCPAAFGYEATLYNHNKLVHLKNKTTPNRASNLPSTNIEPTAAISLNSIWP